MNVDLYLIVTLIFIIIGALIAVETKNLLSAVISLGIMGFGLSIAFLFLQAPDVAIVQIPVEVILLIFLIRATINRDVNSTKEHINWIGLSFICLILIGFIILGYLAFMSLKFGDPIINSVKEAPSNIYIKEGLGNTGSSNIVTSVLLDYRAYDTLGEATVLFTAIIGALAIFRGKARLKKGEKHE